MTEARDDDDLCMCGDYRSQHLDSGPCALNGLGHNLAGDCLSFRPVPTTPKETK